MSRLMTPDEIGVSVIGAAILVVAISAREFASPNIIFQQRDLATETIRGIFTVMLIVTGAISIMLATSAHWLAEAYGEPRLAPFLHVATGTLFVELFNLPIIALWRREMAFGKIMLVNVTGALTTASFSVCLALAGFSYMSFAWASFASVTVMSSMALLMARRFDALKPQFRNLKEIVTFGGYNGITVSLFRLYETVPYVLLGRFVSVEAAALFNRSLTICQMPDKMLLSGVLPVALPAFSAAARSGKEPREAYLHGTSLVTALHWPAFVMLAILAHPLVKIMFGDQWTAIVPLVQTISIASLFSFSFELNYPVLVAVGAMRSVFLRALIVFPIGAAIVTIASMLGLKAVAYAMLIVIPLNAFVSLYFVCRHISITWREIAASVRSSCWVTAATALGPLCLINFLGIGFDMSIGWAIVCALLAAIGWCLSLWAVKHPIFDELVKLIPFVRQPKISEGKAF
jgi:O-antigen/teichoic acid export membrane protein